MEEEFKQLFIKHQDRGPNRDFICHAFDLLLKENPSLEDYISDFQVHYYFEHNIGSYNLKTRVLSVNIQNLYERIIDYRVENRKVLAVEVIQHELNHVRQIQKLYEGEEDLEKFILSCSFKSFCLEHGLIHDVEANSNNHIEKLNLLRSDNYDINPSERLAELNAWKYVISLLGKIGNKNDLETAREMLIRTYQNGYQKGKHLLYPPTYQFLINLELFQEYEELKERVFKNQYDSQTRFTYGFNVTQEEIENENKILIKQKKFIDINKKIW